MGNIVYIIKLLELIASAFDISWYFQGLEEFKKTVIRNIIVKLISVICIFLFVKESSDLFIYFVIYVFSNFIGNISLWPYLPKYITKVNIKKLDIKRHIKPTLVLFLPQIATQIYTVLDKTMIGVFISDKSEVGFYEQAQKIVKLLIALVTSLGTVMMPRIANFYALGKSKLLKEYILKSMHFIQMLSIPLMFGIISISKKFVSVFYGNGYDKVIILLIIISPIVIALGLSNLIGIQFLLPTKQQKKFTISVIVGAITNFCLNLILIPKFKSVGACIATVFAEFFVVFSQLIMVKNDIKIMDILFASYKYFISAIIMFICSIVIGYFINNNVISIVVQILFSFIVYFSLLTLFKEKMVFEVINKIKNYIHLT